MKSLVEEALARDSGLAGTGPVTSYGMQQPPEPTGDASDAELIELLQKLRTNVKIIGCGGGGSNTIARIYAEGIAGAEMYACNTDAQHLLAIRAPHKVLLGGGAPGDLGAGALPQVGEAAALEAEPEIKKILEDANLVFVTAGMGGGTGTGSAATIAGIAKEMGALTVAVVTTPFKGEGRRPDGERRMGTGAAAERRPIPSSSSRTTSFSNWCPRLSLNAAFKVADEVLMRAIKGITELITKPGLVNLDFNDVKTIMKGAGVAMIGLGESDGHAEDRALEAIEAALNSPLLEVDISRRERRPGQRHRRTGHDHQRCGEGGRGSRRSAYRRTHASSGALRSTRPWSTRSG